ncbi:hypothetical protein XENORESO_014143, partial [Xenotaenia resolanae]
TEIRAQRGMVHKRREEEGVVGKMGAEGEDQLLNVSPEQSSGVRRGSSSVSLKRCTQRCFPIYVSCSVYVRIEIPPGEVASEGPVAAPAASVSLSNAVRSVTLLG